MQSNSEGGILIGRFLFMANPLFIRNLISEPHTRKADTNPVILVSRTVQVGNTKLPGIAGYEWVPARIGCFGNKKYLFLKYQRPI